MQRLPNSGCPPEAAQCCPATRLRRKPCIPSRSTAASSTPTSLHPPPPPGPPPPPPALPPPRPPPPPPPPCLPPPRPPPFLVRCLSGAGPTAAAGGTGAGTGTAGTATRLPAPDAAADPAGPARRDPVPPPHPPLSLYAPADPDRAAGGSLTPRPWARPPALGGGGGDGPAPPPRGCQSAVPRATSTLAPKPGPASLKPASGGAVGGRPALSSVAPARLPLTSRSAGPQAAADARWHSGI